MKKIPNVSSEADICLCTDCTCTGCHEDCYKHCHGCGKPVTECNAYQTEGEKNPCKELVGNSDKLPAFDYSGLDEQASHDLELAESEYHAGCRIAERGLRMMANAVAIAHDVLCGSCDNLSQLKKHGNRGENSFGSWCASIGINRKQAERLLHVNSFLENSTPSQQAALDELSPSLLYAAAKPSAPAEAVAAVKSGDITTLKQYRELEEKCKAAEAAVVAAEAAAAAAKDVALATAKRAEEAERGNKAAQMVIQKQKSDNEKLREENAALRRRPIEIPAAVQPDPAEIDRLAQEKAEKITADLQKQAQKSRDYEWERDSAYYDIVANAAKTIQGAWEEAAPVWERMDSDAREMLYGYLQESIKGVQAALASASA